MRKTLPFSVIAIFAMLFTVSCTRDDSILTLDAQNHAVEKSDHSVSVENALKYLEGDLAMIDPEETRATQPRIVKSVKHVPFKSVRSTTRAAADAPNDISDLLYLVEFEDGRGSAVLGADDRIEPVLAVLDESVLTIDDFTATDNNGDISKYVASLIKEAAINMASILPPILPPDKDTTILDKNDYLLGEAYDTSVILIKSPLIKTKWGQDTPYNNYCPIINNKHCPAGCGAIAASQIIASNKYPDSLISDDEYFNWDLIEQTYYGHTPTSAGYDETARLIYNIGRRMDTDYKETESTVFASKMHKAFTHIYSNVINEEYSRNKSRSMIRDNKPIMMFGNNPNSGHFWIIDGWREYNVVKWILHIYKYRKIGSPRIDSIYNCTYYNYKMHCNFGWNGQCDGYYSDNIFDVTTPNLDIDETVGDIISTNTNPYTDNFKIVTYTLGNQ